MKKWYTQPRRKAITDINKKRKANLTDHNLRRIRLLKHTVEGKIQRRIQVRVRRRRNCKSLLDDLKKTIGNIRSHFEKKGYGLVVRQSMAWRYSTLVNPVFLYLSCSLCLFPCPPFSCSSCSAPWESSSWWDFFLPPFSSDFWKCCCFPVPAFCPE